MATPSKLDILRAAGRVQRELAAEAITEEVEAQVHASDHNVTSRRKAPGAAAIDPVEQIALAQDELVGVNDQLRSDQDLLRHLRGNAQDTETEFEDHFTDAEEQTTAPGAAASSAGASASAASFSPD